MTLKEKLEFLAKHSDGSEFEILCGDGSWVKSNICVWLSSSLYTIRGLDFREIVKPKYTLTQEQKNLINVIPKNYKWFSRNCYGVWATTVEPKFDEIYKDYTVGIDGLTDDMNMFDELLLFVKLNEKVSLDELREIAKEK